MLMGLVVDLNVSPYENKENYHTDYYFNIINKHEPNSHHSQVV